MTPLIAQIAKLTQLRLKDDLDLALATMMYDAVHARELRLLRLDGRGDDFAVSKYIDLPSERQAGTAVFRTLGPLEPLNAATRADFRRCCEDKEHLKRPSGDARSSSHLFPVLDGRKVVFILEIITPFPLTNGSITLVLALLEIYCNVVSMLDSSDRDELTGLFNRRTFGESFKRVVKPITALAGQTPKLDRRRDATMPIRCHLAVLDIDFFKRINDEFGHPYGDEVLVLLARLMGESFRENDVTFRFGGEEFLVILSNTDLQGAEMVLERFRAKVEAFHFSQVGRVTVSIGFTLLLPGDSGPGAFGRADQALYIAKHSGRNQVQSYELLVASGALISAAGHEQEVELF